MLQKTTILLSLLLTITACNESGDSGTSQPGTTTECVQCGEFIPNNKSELGQIANYLIDNDASFDNWYNAKGPLENDQMYSDAQLVHAVRGFVHSKAKSVDGNGKLNVLSETPYDAFFEAVINNGGGSRGVDNIGLCHLFADALNSFTVPTTVIVVTGSTHQLAPGGTYCIVEADFLNGSIALDPMLNRSFKKGDSSKWVEAGVETSRDAWMSANDLLVSIEAGLAPEMGVNPDGMLDAHPDWAPLGDYYKTYEGLASSHSDREALVADLHEQTFVNITYTKYSELR